METKQTYTLTPGPWTWQKVSPVGGDTDLFFIGRGKFDKTEGNEVVAEVLSDEAHMLGDMRVLAAAPDLLEALKALTNALFETGLATLPGDAAFEVRRCCDDAMIAIDRATK